MYFTFKNWLISRPWLLPLLPAWGNFKNHLKLHGITVIFVVKVLIPLMIRTRKRPVLFFRLVGIGDILCTFPAVQEIKRRHRGVPGVYSCQTEYACLPRLAGVAEVVAPFSAEILKTWWAFLFCAVYQFQYGDLKSSFASTEILIDSFARQYGVTVDGEHPHLMVPPTATAKAKAALGDLPPAAGPLIIIHPGPTWPVKQWPKSAWAELAEQLRHQGFSNIAQIGVGRLPLSNVTHDISIPGVRSLMDEFTLEESVALIAEADLFVGIDSGLLHIAASLRIPSVGIFGPTTPEKYYSPHSSCSFVTSSVECQGCHHRLPCQHWITGCPYNIKCMQEISADAVAAACVRRLRAN